jgi:hypothetical protein
MVDPPGSALRMLFAPLLQGQENRPQFSAPRGQEILQPRRMFGIVATANDGARFKVLQSCRQDARRQPWTRRFEILKPAGFEAKQIAQDQDGPSVTDG